MKDNSLTDYSARIKEVTNIQFEQPGGRGNTNTGNSARIFFPDGLSFDTALSYIPQQDRENLKFLHGNL